MSEPVFARSIVASTPYTGGSATSIVAPSSVAEMTSGSAVPTLHTHAHSRTTAEYSAGPAEFYVTELPFSMVLSMYPAWPKYRRGPGRSPRGRRVRTSRTSRGAPGRGTDDPPEPDLAAGRCSRGHVGALVWRPSKLVPICATCLSEIDEALAKRHAA